MSSRAAHEIFAGRLIGRRVHDASGRRVGRVSDIVAHKEDGEIVVASYLVGPHGWVQRFAIHGLGLRLRSLAWRYRVNWDQMDLSDPHHPRLTCRAEDLPIERLPPRKRGLKRRPGRSID
jgi:sporulation protein YlmC with PRC-barrel domain